MTSSIIDQLAKQASHIHLCKKYILTYDELLTRISDYFAKNKSNAVALKYYYDNKDNLEYQDKLKLSRCT